MLTAMIRLVKFLIWLFLGSFLVWFAVTNHQPVFISFKPFAAGVHTAPWVLLFAGIFFGLVSAGLVTGWYRLVSFVEKRQIKRQHNRLVKDVEILSQQVHTGSADISHQNVERAADFAGQGVKSGNKYD